MADSKITALTALTAADPANDMMPIVDVSDTSMAASGTTKRISINNILACSPTATLASATITGDLTVDTNVLKVDSANNRVGILTASPLYSLDVRGTIAGGNGTIFGGVTFSSRTEIGALSNHDVGIIANSVTQYLISTGGNHTWYNGGSTAMTLNSTGLGVGEAASVSRLQPRGSTSDSSAYILYGKASSGNVICFMRNDGRFLVGNGTTDNLIVTETGNVGIGVTPSAWNAAFRGIDISTGGAIAGSSDSVRLFSNSAFNTAGNNVYKNAATAGRYDIQGNVHTWNISTNTPSAGGTITFSPAMTLDASGNLLVGTTSTAGSSSNATALVLGGARTANGTVSATTAVATTIFSITAALTGRYEVVALIGFSGAPAQYTAIATIIWDGNGSRVVANNGANLTITISGSNVQITQTSGSTQTVSWSFLRIAL